MEDYWHADDAFFALLRDKQVLTRIVAEVAGETVAAAHANEKTKTMKRIVRDHLDGTNGRQQIIDWVPRWMTFPPTSFTARGGARAEKRRVGYECVNACRSRWSPDP